MGLEYPEAIISIMSFSGIYGQETFYKREWIRWIDCENLSGTEGYCDEAAVAAIEQKLKGLSPGGLHFIDNGNYHYVTLFWIKKIQTPFNLIVMDHHSDMKPPAFGDLLSCGSWVLQALKTLDKLKKVVIVGLAKEQERFIPAALKDRVTGLEQEALKHCHRWLPADVPVYISVDKDVLCEAVVETNWDQGEMTLRELERLLADISARHRVIGGDICGECGILGPDAREIRASDQVNRKLLELTRYLGDRGLQKTKN